MGSQKVRHCWSMKAPQGWYMVWHVCYTIALGVKAQRDFQGGATGKESTCQCRRYRFHSWVGKIPGGEHGNPHQCSYLENLPYKAGDERPEFNPWIRKIPWSRKWQPTPAFLPREFHGQRSGLQPMGLQRVVHD